MRLPVERLPRRLPRRFPVGATYVIEGYGAQEGDLRVIARYVVLPGGRRINVPADLRGPPPRRALGLSAALGILSNLEPKADPSAAAKKS